MSRERGAAISGLHPRRSQPWHLRTVIRVIRTVFREFTFQTYPFLSSSQAISKLSPTCPTFPKRCQTIPKAPQTMPNLCLIDSALNTWPLSERFAFAARRGFLHIVLPIINFGVNNSDDKILNPRNCRPDMRTFLPKWQSAARSRLGGATGRRLFTRPKSFLDKHLQPTAAMCPDGQKMEGTGHIAKQAVFLRSPNAATCFACHLDKDRTTNCTKIRTRANKSRNSMSVLSRSWVRPGCLLGPSWLASG